MVFFFLTKYSCYFILTSFFSFSKAIQITHINDEWVDDAHKEMKEEEGWHIAAVEAFTIAE